MENNAISMSGLLWVVEANGYILHTSLSVRKAFGPCPGLGQGTDRVKSVFACFLQNESAVR